MQFTADGHRADNRKETTLVSLANFENLELSMAVVPLNPAPKAQ